MLLYSNIDLLTKYDKEVPQTWDQLIDTTKYIMEREHAEENYNIIGFSNLFPSTY